MAVYDTDNHGQFSTSANTETTISSVPCRVGRITVYKGPGQAVPLFLQLWNVANPTLDGGDVLPGFRLGVRDLFAELDRKANP